MEIIKSQYSKKESEKFVKNLVKYSWGVVQDLQKSNLNVSVKSSLHWAPDGYSLSSTGIIVKRRFSFLNNLVQDVVNGFSCFDEDERLYAGIKLERKMDPYLAHIPFLKQHGLVVNSIDETFLRKFDENLQGSSIEPFLKKYDIKTQYFLSDNTREWR